MNKAFCCDVDIEKIIVRVHRISRLMDSLFLEYSWLKKVLIKLEINWSSVLLPCFG